MHKSLLAVLLVVAVVAGAFAMLTSNKNKKSAELVKKQGVNMEIPVKIFSVEQKSLDRKIKINGVLSAKRQVTVLAETAGQIERIYREVGDVVQIGSQLALVDASVIAAQMETARASLTNNQRDLERFQKLAQTGAATQQTVDNLKLAVESATANVVALQKQLKNTTIRSPQKGVVVQRMVEVGSVIGGGSPTFRVADLSDMIMKIGLTEMEIVQVKLGMPAKVRVDALNKDLDAVIHTVGIVADMSGRYSVDVLIKDPSAKGVLRPDLAGSVSLDLPTMKDAIVIPRDALVDGVKDPKVYIVENGKATLRRIALSLIEGTNAVVQEGLSLNEQVVVTGHQNLYENASVRILQ